ncbi:E3 ubiquitin-protein ligase RSL1-like isoform X2 [Nymphaea colorata]|uniref:E3 ubiquitin-protein ligase RSL1-like isoform X2 n=1 Tax=Nymphaea colorata TaxID=210225 RepID=UPI00129D8E69|nr:E3 ubiquitin-protein ligase RSL1-like isoform X2 [Nymphaea colorata]
MKRSGKETVKQATMEEGRRMIMTREMTKECKSSAGGTDQRSRLTRAQATEFNSAGQGLVEEVSSRRIRKNAEVKEVGILVSNHTASKISPTVRPPKFLCNICMERKPLNRSFRPDCCTHLFCSDCVVVHIATKIRENVCTIRCMESGCTSVIELKSCLGILTAEVSDRWAALLSESLIQPADKYYCPFKDCSALLWNDTAEKQAIKEAECPHCHRLFCAQCKVGWHAGIDCREYRRMVSWERSDDAVMKNLANTKKWRRCSKCQVYVEKISGCLQITCRCGFIFCYNCGSAWSPQHYQCRGLL